MRLERDLPNADVMEPQMPHNKRREKTGARDPQEIMKQLERQL